MALKTEILRLFVMTSLLCITKGFGEPSEIKVTVDLTSRMCFHGRDTLSRSQFFATNGSDLDLQLSEDLKQLNFWPGKVSVDLSTLKIPQDPQKPGFAQSTFFDTPLALSDTLLSLGESMPNFFTCLIPIYSCPAYMQEPGMPTTPSNFNAHAQMTVNTILNLERFSMLPDYYEIWSEPNNPQMWGWMGRSISIGWNKYTDYCKAVIPKLKQATRSIKIAGPGDSDVSEWPINGFSSWSYRKNYLETIGSQLDLFSFRFLQMNASQFNASLDLISNYSKATLKTIKPILISEFCGKLEDKTATAENYWDALHSCFEELILCISHPHVEKAIPFFSPTAKPINKQFIGQLFDDNGPTPLYDFVNLWQPVEGYYLFSSSSSDAIICAVFLDDMDLQTVYIALSNTTAHNVNVDIGLKGDPLISQAKQTRLFWDGNGPASELDTLFLDVPLKFTPHECKVLTLFLDTPLENLPEAKGEIYYSGINFAPIISQITTQIELPENVTNAILRYSTQRPENVDQAPDISVNGYFLPSHNGPIGGKGNFGSSQIEIPIAYLRKKNSVTFRYKMSGGYMVSIAILASSLDKED